VRAERSVSATVTPAPRDSEIGGRKRLGTGPAGERFIDADNIADMVGAVLTDDSHADPPIDAAGRQNSSFDEAVERLAEATGRRIRYVRVSTERCAALLADHDVPDEVFARLARVLVTLLGGGNAQPTPGVERAIRRAQRDVADCARPASSARVSQEHPACSRSRRG
jgi:uncharacterized protein YbjT (DUF2867 family)